MAKKTPEINSSSTADMAFILLCFFLMTTTMDQDKGLQRRLPPMPDPNQQAQDQKVNRRNIIVVKINSADRLLAGTEPMDVSQLKDKIKEFLSNPLNDPSLPEKEEIEIEGFGPCMVSKGVISLQNDRGTSYQAQGFSSVFLQLSFKSGSMAGQCLLTLTSNLLAPNICELCILLQDIAIHIC